MAEFDGELLLHEVSLRRVLWDVYDEYYGNREFTTNAWAEVCRQLLPDFDSSSEEQKSVHENFVKNKWKNIRDSFVKRIKVNFEGNGRCKYEDSLMFLKDMYSAKIEKGTSRRGKGQRKSSTASAAKKKPATWKVAPKKAEASANRTPVSERTLRRKNAVVYREATPPSSDDEETSTRRVTRASKRRAALRRELLPAKRRRAEPTEEDVAEPLGDEDEQSGNVDDDSSQSTGQEEAPTGQEEETTGQEEETTGQEEEESTGQEEEESTVQEEEETTSQEEGESTAQEEEEPTGEAEASDEEDAASQVDESGSQQDESADEEPSNQEDFVRPNPTDVTSSASKALVQNLAGGPMETLRNYRPSHVSFVSISSEGEIDEDVAFFKSCLNMIKKFDDDDKVEFRTETLKLIQRIRSHKSVKNVYLLSPVSFRMNS